MKSYIDIHSHILPGLDDGPENMEQCVEAARRYRAIGMDCVIATPHWFNFTGWSSSPEQIIRKAAEVEQALKEAGAVLKILPGMEIGFTDRLEQDFQESRLLPLGASGFYLIEFPLMVAFMKPEQLILPLMRRQKKTRVILAHPERCIAFLDNDASLRVMEAKGVLVQMNISSILGGFGKQIQQTAVRLLRKGLVHFLATDSHASGRRMPPDINEWDMLREYIGGPAVVQACSINPRRLLAGESVNPVLPDVKRLDKYFPGTCNKNYNKMSNLDSNRGYAGRFLGLFSR
ncbi:MAG: CpsB/CapC family capsule biosynthesis tyrosine phosphatase [Desulfobulbaceae bacterium]|nr:CpsB/CapC family capsule biosynthesis tyrosine phosphatase [Desulfobulbaceae bacterium]